MPGIPVIQGSVQDVIMLNTLPMISVAPNTAPAPYADTQRNSQPLTKEH